MAGSDKIDFALLKDLDLWILYIGKTCVINNARLLASKKKTILATTAELTKMHTWFNTLPTVANSKCTTDVIHIYSG